MEIREQKQMLRRIIRERNEAMRPEERTAWSKEITKRVLALTEYQDAGCVLGFVGVRFEPDTFAILRDVLASGKRLCLPLCLDRETMVAVEVTDLAADLAVGSYGLLEPKNHLPRVDKEEIDFAIIPCVACDAQGNRLGHGAGYYDRYLEGIAMPMAMLCFENVLVPDGEIPVGPYDLPIRPVITDRRG